MGFRINRGIFQFKDAATETYINKFKIDERDGALVEVDSDGNAVTGYLKVGEKASDADKLDGINSSQFLRSDANDTKTGDTTFTGKVTLQTNLVITEDAPTISFLDTSSEDDFYIHVNSNNFYVLRNTANSENTVDGGWDSPHPLQLEGDTNKAYIFGNLIGTAAYQASSAFDAAGAADAVEATLTPLISTAQTTADTALARADGAREDTVAIGELATAAQAAADAAQATADSKLGATAKAADSDKLDGLNSTQFLRSDASDTMSGDLTISNGRITIKRGTGLTHAEWEDDSTAGGRGQLILDSHYSDLIIASRNANTNKHGSTLTFATQSTSTNDVAKWVIGQGQYQEGANHLAFAYGTNQTNPHGILGTDNTNADFVIMDGRMVCIGGTVDKQAYSATGSTRLMFGGANTDAQSNYYIGTNMEDYGGNYTKLDLRWHTGIRMGAQAGYGGIRFYDSEDLGSVIFSVGQGDANVRVSNSLYVLGSSNSGRLYADDFGIKVGTDAGYIQFGPANTSWAHIYTDRANFYFNKNIYVSGSILSTRSWAQGVADTAESNATAAANARIDDELVPQITANTDAITSNRNEITTVAAAAAAAQSTADGKLGATAKAADSNLLDGLDSGAFIRSNADDNVSGNTEWQDNKQVRLGNGADFRMWHDGSHTYFRNYNHGTGNFYWQGEDTEGTNHALLYMINDVSEPYIKFYANGGEKLRTTTGGITVYGSITVDGNVSANQVFMQSITSDGTIANDKGSYLHLGGWAVGRTDASAVLVNTAYRADYATSLFDMNISRFTNNSGYITQSSIDTFAEELRGEIQTAQTTADNAATAAATAQTTADGKLGATAKAADADKLDGYDWMQSGKNVRATEFYADNWFRNYNSGEGLYNQATAVHWYSDATSRLRLRSGSTTESTIMLATSDNTVRGYLYATSSNHVGILDAGGSWGIKHINDNGTYFYTDNSTEEFKVGRDAVTGNYGTVQTSTTRGGWGGYSIAGRVVFMHDHSNGWGIYNDVNNEWMVYGSLNGSVQLRYNNATKIETNSGGVTVTGTVTATAFSGSGAGLTNLNVPDQSIPVSINGEGGNILVGMNMNLDMGQIEFTLSNGQTFTAMMGR